MKLACINYLIPLPNSGMIKCIDLAVIAMLSGIGGQCTPRIVFKRNNGQMLFAFTLFVKERVIRLEEKNTTAAEPERETHGM